MAWDRTKGMNFIDDDLSEDLCKRQELLDVKNRKSRQEILVQDASSSYKFKF